MGNSDKHLLEIFQDIEKSDRSEASSAEGISDVPKSRRPEASVEPVQLRVPADRRLWSEAVACIAAFALGVLTDRLLLNPGGGAEAIGAGVAHAEAPGQSEQREDELTRPPYETAGNAGSAAEGAGSAAPSRRPSHGASAPPSPLHDPANEFVVQAATYNSGQGGQATTTYESLLEEGLPAFPPQKVGRQLVLLVGASPTRAELNGILDQVLRMPGLGSAYIVRKSQLGID